MYADFDCDVHFPDLAPYGLPPNSADTSLEGIETNLKLVEVEDQDVQVLVTLQVVCPHFWLSLSPGGPSVLREWNQIYLPRVPIWKIKQNKELIFLGYIFGFYSMKFNLLHQQRYKYECNEKWTDEVKDEKKTGTHSIVQT